MKNGETVSIENIKLKLHIKYMLLIFSIVVIALFVFACFLWPYNDNVAQKIGFAGTVSSIILSVLAIIVTLSGESKVDTAREKINVSISQLEDVTEEIKKSYTELQNITLVVNGLNNNVTESIGLLHQKMDIFVETKSDELKESDYAGIISIFNQLSGGKIGKEVLALIYYNYYKFKKGDSTIEQDKVQELLQKLECDEKDASYLLGIGVPFWPLFKANLEKPFGKIVEEKVEEKGFKERLDEIINSL